jgi:carbon-monoxide dehydrogenase small subunit
LTDRSIAPGVDHAFESQWGADLMGLDDRPRASYTLRVNGADRPVVDAWIGESLLYVLRERLGLAGAKDGCEQGECGACSVMVEGQLVDACLVPAALAAGSDIHTVEGLTEDGSPSDVQRALAESGAVQCGYCAPGMAMALHDLLQRNHRPTEVETRQALCGNLCRCTGYQGALDAVRTVAEARQAQAEADAAQAEARAAEAAEARAAEQPPAYAYPADAEADAHDIGPVYVDPGYQEYPGPAPYQGGYGIPGQQAAPAAEQGSYAEHAAYAEQGGYAEGPAQEAPLDPLFGPIDAVLGATTGGPGTGTYAPDPYGTAAHTDPYQADPYRQSHGNDGTIPYLHIPQELYGFPAQSEPGTPAPPAEEGQ